MIEAIAQKFPFAIYHDQKKLVVHQTNNILSLYAGGTLSNNTYKWFKNGQLNRTISGDSTLQPSQSGAYTVRLLTRLLRSLHFIARRLFIQCNQSLQCHKRMIC